MEGCVSQALLLLLSITATKAEACAACLPMMQKYMARQNLSGNTLSVFHARQTATGKPDTANSMSGTECDSVQDVMNVCRTEQAQGMEGRQQWC